MAKTVTFRIHERPDGKFEARNGNPKDCPLGVDASLSMAVGSARREATMTARNEGCIVLIEAVKHARRNHATNDTSGGTSSIDK